MRTLPLPPALENSLVPDGPVGFGDLGPSIPSLPKETQTLYDAQPTSLAY